MSRHQCAYCDIAWFFFSSRRRHTRWPRDWSSDVCSSDLTISEAQRRRAMELVRDASTPPETFLRLKQADAFMGSLKKLIEDKNLAFYAELPNAWHHAMTDYITAYARHLQDAVCGQFSDTCAFESEIGR